MEMKLVRPRLTDDVLVNPNMGFTTFQRFNGDSLFENRKWTEFGPECFEHAGEPPADEWPPAKDFPESTIAYCRWYWGTLNPEPGVIRFDIVENACRSAAARGQQLDLRIMPHNSSVTVPDWYKKIAPGGVKDAFVPGGNWMPDYAHPAYLEHFGGLVREMGRRFDGDPRINMVDVGMFGHWGEWHRKDGGMGTPELWIRGIDLFLDAWPRTRKAMLIAETPRLRYACDRGCGWRLDCWGDMGGFSPTWNHMLDCYNQAIAKTGVEDAWRKGPVSLEVCWVMSKWLDEGWDIDYIVDQALRWHTTSINLKSSAVPESYWPHVRRLQREMGYRIALRRIQYASEVPAGGALKVVTSWENRGVAPPYAGYPAALCLKAGSSEHVLMVEPDTSGWLPGWRHYEQELALGAGVKPGKYRLCAGMLDPHTRRPRVRLAMELRAADGWYDLGEVEVKGA